MAHNKPISGNDKIHGAVVSVAAKIPTSEAASDVAKLFGNKATVTLFRSMQNKLDGSLSKLAENNYGKKAGKEAQQPTNDASSQTPKLK